MERTMVPPQLETLDIFKAAEYVNNNVKDSSKISLKPAELLYEKINPDCDNFKYYNSTVSLTIFLIKICLNIEKLNIFKKFLTIIFQDHI